MSNGEVGTLFVLMLALAAIVGVVAFFIGHADQTQGCNVTPATGSVYINHGQYVVINGRTLVCIDGNMQPIQKAVLP